MFFVKRVVLLLVLYIAMVFSAFAKPNLRFEHILGNFSDDKRPTGVLPFIVRDHSGFMWFAGEKVYRYDGVEFRSYLEEEQEGCSSFVRGMTVDHGGVLWVATERGLCIFDEKNDGFKPFHLALPSSPIDLGALATVNVSPSNEIYVGSVSRFAIIDAERSQISYFDTPLADEFSDGNNEFRHFFFESDEVVWIGSQQTGLIRFTRSNGAFEHIMNSKENPNVLPSNDVQSIVQDTDGYLWFGMHQGGVSKLDPSRKSIKHYYDRSDRYGLGSPYVWHLLVDSEGQLWASSDGGGLIGYDRENDSFFHYWHDANNPDSIASNKTVYTYEDSDKNLWVSLYPSGIELVNRKHSPIEAYRHNPAHKDSLNSSGILSVTVDSQERIWVGTEKGLNLFDPISKTFEDYSSASEAHWHVNPSPITAIVEAKDGNLWLGTWGDGLYHIDTTQQNVTHYKANKDDRKTVDTSHIWDILPGENRTLFASEGKKGILVYHHQKKIFERETFNSGTGEISSGYTYSLLLDSRNQYWVGAIGGLFSVDAQGNLSIHSSRKSEGNGLISSYRIRSLFEDKQGRIWMGSEDQGAFIYNPKNHNVAHLGREQGLASTNVTLILQSEDGFVWLFTRNGLAKVNPVDFSTRTFNYAHGLASSNFNRGAGFIDGNGTIYAGGAEGLSVFGANALDSGDAEFPVHITEFKLFNRSVGIGEDDSPLERSILDTDHIVLNYLQHIFSFSFAGLSYSLPHGNQYAYKLEGFEQDWNYVGNRNTATYTNIPPGRYVFKVKAASSNGSWSKHSDSVVVEITPPPWRTWWAYGLYLAMIALVIRFILMHKTKKMEYEKEKAVNEEILRANIERDEMRRNFTAEVSHELKTPLSILAGEIEAIEDGIRPFSTHSLASLSTEVSIINKLVNDLFELSLADIGELKYRFQVVDLRGLLEQVAGQVEKKLLLKDISLAVEMPSEPLIINADPLRIHQLFLNLLENAFRYTDPGGQVILRAAEDDARFVTVELSDSKPGVAESHLGDLFQRFYRGEPSRNRASGGSGLGLSICRNIAEAHRASIEAMASPLGGLCIVTRFPKAN